MIERTVGMLARVAKMETVGTGAAITLPLAREWKTMEVDRQLRGGRASDVYIPFCSVLSPEKDMDTDTYRELGDCFTMISCPAKREV